LTYQTSRGHHSDGSFDPIEYAYTLWAGLS
jgi:hypothetical protein